MRIGEKGSPFVRFAFRVLEFGHALGFVVAVQHVDENENSFVCAQATGWWCKRRFKA